MQRLRKLRAEALENQVNYDEFYFKYYRAYKKNEGKSEEERYADSLYEAFSLLTPTISDGELIVGKPTRISDEDKRLWEENYRENAMKMTEKTRLGQDSHMTIDNELLLRCGVSGIIDKINEYLKTCGDDKKPFYKACKKCLEAVLILSEKYADRAEQLADAETDEKKRRELEVVSKICRRVPRYPAQTFHEAVQSVHFISYCLSMNPQRLCNQQFQLGRPDRYLLPYFERDIQNKSLTRERAQLILDCLGIQINNRVPNGLSSGYMVGGRDKNNNIVQNELTEMCMRVVDDIRLVYPAVGLCCTEGMDEKYLETACEILSHGCSHPAIFNDDVITKGLRLYGVPEEEAHDYIHSTCVEITPIASSNVWVASPYTNLPQILLDITGREYADINELKKCYFEKLSLIIKTHFEEQNQMRRVRSESAMTPLLSCFVNDCLEKGEDIEKGGARYNWIMPSFVGLANLTDSFMTIKKLVFEEKSLSMGELKKILDNNFEGHEQLHNKIIKAVPKYGNDIDEADEFFAEAAERIIDECKKYTAIHSNGRIIPSVFCWVMHEYFGRETGATPDGRLAGFPLGDGSGPCQGREMNGPTSSVLSSTKWSHCEFIGGVAVNMKFAKKSLGASSVETIKNLVKVYLQRGGFEMQINVVDKKTLERAVTNPEEYRDLVVRIGGYSDYFVKLSPNMQREVILRTEHVV